MGAVWALKAALLIILTAFFWILTSFVKDVVVALP
jgi:hypothetical protein